MKVLIIGGVAGGATAAARIRRLDEKAEIIILERSGFVSYANCGLPYYIGGVIEDADELTLQSPASFKRRFRIDVRVKNEAVKIDPNKKEVTVRRLDTGETYVESYDKLLLSPGARPAGTNLPGADLEGVFSLRTVEDTLRIREFAQSRKPKSVVIAGGGFIGLEMAENLSGLGIKVTIVQRPKQVLTPLDEDMAAFLHNLLRGNGIDLRLGCGVSEFKKDKDGLVTILNNNEALRSDMIILAIGVSPDTNLAKDAGLELGIKDSIVVNDRMETSIPDIYAVGDAVEVKHYVSGAKALISLAGPANKQGRIAADNICGLNSRFKGSMGSSVIKLFERTAASTGLNEKTAKAAGIDYSRVVLTTASHATYYPGASSMTMKVLYEKGTMKIIGAQIIGRDGVDKRIDVLATAIQAGMNAVQLKDLDLAYAPPYSSAKDPVNMAGFMIENAETGKVKQFFIEDLDGLSGRSDITLLDARTVFEYQMGHLEGTINIPVDELRAHLDEIPKDKPVYVMCQSGLRSYIACRILSGNGYDCYNFSGGYGFYKTVVLDQKAAEEAYPCGMEKTV